MHFVSHLKKHIAAYNIHTCISGNGPPPPLSPEATRHLLGKHSSVLLALALSMDDKGIRTAPICHVGPLMGWGGGVLMSHVDFKKCQCRMSLSLNSSPVPCRIFKMPMSHVTIFFLANVAVAKDHVALSNLGNGHVALSILGV